MKTILKLPNNRLYMYKLLLSIICMLIVSCATYNEQFIEGLSTVAGQEQPTHTFYIAGGYGEHNNQNSTRALSFLKETLSKASKNSTLIYTGDNVSDAKAGQSDDMMLLNQQLSILSEFPGQTIFLPGKNEWKSKNTEHLNVYDAHLKAWNKAQLIRVFKESCPIERLTVNDQIELIFINSMWFLSDWDSVQNINKHCPDIVTRRRFAEELEDYIKDAQGKNIIIAMHHPVFSNGKNAGHQTFKEQLLPLPIVQSIYSGTLDLGAFSSHNLNSKRYYEFRALVTSLAQESDRITFISGHENSLQFLKTSNGLSQVISGTLSKIEATKRTKDNITAIGGTLSYEGQYTNAAHGFAKLDYFKDGSSSVTFYTIGDDNKTRTFKVLGGFGSKSVTHHFKIPKTPILQKAVFSEEDKERLEKSGTYKFLWGDRHRSYYGKPVTVPVTLLDTLYGGLKVIKKGGGHQSYSLRLADKSGREYAMRSLKKNALRFLKFKLKGIAYNQEIYKSTTVEEITSDFFTTAHPYMQLVISPMAKAVAVNHAQAELYYVPKQEALGIHNDLYGDELYFIEERPSDQQSMYEGFNRTVSKGKIINFESTTDVLEKLKRDESYTINERAHIRARIFDMLIGDWDRHESQWRWAELQKEDGTIEFQPIPRDRDGTFSKFDGIGIPLIQMLMPDTRFWQTYSGDIPSVKWFNAEGNNLDRALLNRFGREVWVEEAQYIQQQLTDVFIDNAFLRLPKEVQDQTATQFKGYLKERLEKLHEFANEYAGYLNKTIAIHATHKDDIIEVERLNHGRTRVIIKRNLSHKENKVFYDRIFDKSETKELWIYGLNSKDVFKVYGHGDTSIFIRLIGGYGKDVYSIENAANVKIYDLKYEHSELTHKTPKTFFTNQYETNAFHWRYFNENNNIILPNLGFRTDDGLVLGVSDTYTYKGFNGNPFRQQHSVSVNYYSEFNGVDISYNGVWANLFPKWNFQLEAYATNDRYSTNFFGYGNDTKNFEDDLTRDFYRSRMRQIQLNAGLEHSFFSIKAIYENFKVDEIPSRLFTKQNLPKVVFESQSYVGGEVALKYGNADVIDFPTRAFYSQLTAGYKANLDISDNKFGYASLQVSAARKLIPSGDIVLSSTLGAKTNFGDDFFYYHAPSIGGNNGLRGFRDERFTGKSYFYHSTDLRFRLKRFHTGVLPLTMGIYGGFDYGRVWVDNDNSNSWHTSQGLGFWVSGLNSFTLRFGYFNSDETNILQVGLGFRF